VHSYEKLFGKSARGVLSICFFKLGKNTARSLTEKHRLKSVDELFEKIREMGTSFNWFKEIKWEKVNENEYVIKLWDSPTARTQKKKKCCEPFALWFAGLITAMLGKEFEGEELACRCEGNEYCEFRVYRNEIQ
jgi:predicted hydrocarbon binding protein